jgi:hypothetical protein
MAGCSDTITIIIFTFGLLLRIQLLIKLSELEQRLTADCSDIETIILFTFGFLFRIQLLINLSELEQLLMAGCPDRVTIFSSKFSSAQNPATE